MRKRRLCAVLAAGLLVAFSAAPAGAATAKPTGIYAGMGDCPLSSPVLADPGNQQVGCVVSVTRGGSVTIGSTTVALTQPITLQFGVYWPASAPTVEFPDGTVQPGTVVDVGNVATNTTNTPGATPSVTITIGVDNIPSSVDSFVEIPVTLRVVSASVPNAIVVPVSALLALKEGGYAVQEVTGKAADGTDQTKLVGVTPGLFSNGFVQVQGNLTANTDVVVPS